MKALFIHAFFILSTLTFCFPLTTFAQTEGPLVILNWGLYLAPEVEEKFEREFNVEVQQVLYDSDEARDEKLLETNAKGYDLILTSGVALHGYAKRGWLAPLDRSKAPNLKHLYDRWDDTFAGTREYGVPYFWGTLGIVYRSDLVKQPMTSWQQIFKPSEELHGRIMMMDDSREVVSMGLKSLGYSVNSEDPASYKEVGELLLAQKPYVKSYSYVSIQETSPLVTGEVVAAMAYSGDALVVAEHHDAIEYVLPEEGGNIWVDYLVIAAKAKNPELAYAFLNFINDPENAAKQTEYVYYATPNKAAEKFLPQEFLQDQTIYPPLARLEKSEVYKPLSPKASRLRNNVSGMILR